MLVARGFNAYRKQEQRIHGDRGKSARGKREWSMGEVMQKSSEQLSWGILRMGGSHTSQGARTTQLHVAKKHTLEKPETLLNNTKNSY